MLLSDRRFFLLGCAALAGCGFTPVYGPGGAATDLFGQIGYADPTDRNEFDLVRRFEERLGRTSAPSFTLNYALDLTEEDLGISQDLQITRYNLLGVLDFTLIDSTGAVRARGRVDNFTSFSATGTTVSTQSAKQDAYARLMIMLADNAVARFLATSGDWAQ